MLLFGLLPVFGYLLVTSCDQQKSVDYNPCTGVSPFSGGFTISQEIGDTLIEADTVFLNSTIRLKPIGNGIDSMQWQLGSSTPFTQNSEVRKFISDNLYQSTQVGLTLFHKPNLKCFPNDSAVSFVAKRFFITDISKSLVKGIFLGALTDNPKDTFSITIRYFNTPLPYYFLANLPKGCTRSGYIQGYPSNIGFPIDVGYKCFHFVGNTCIPNITGTGILNSNDSLKITYWYYDSVKTDVKVYKTFAGKRIF